MQRSQAWLLAAVLLLGACQPQTFLASRSASSAAPATPTFTPFQPLLPGADAQLTESPGGTAAPAAAAPTLEVPTAAAPTDTPAPPELWLGPGVPPALSQALLEGSGFIQAAGPVQAPVRMEVGGGAATSRWVYALAAPFPTRIQSVSSDDLRQSWRGEPAGPYGGRPLLLSPETRAAFALLWGEPAAGAVQELPAGELLEYAWEQGKAWALLPFEELEARWKVLEVDGQSPLHKDFDLAVYPLVVMFGLQGDAQQTASLSAKLPSSNRDPARLTVLAMTGTTALVRATAFIMEQKGVNYPARDVGDLLSSADLTHISNEAPFAKDCPSPDAFSTSMRFCSDPRYIGLLETVGTDIVELTGDHFLDWGNAPMLLTLDMYHERGWLHYGGGYDLDDARRPLKVEHNGNRLAFLGCNAKGPGFAQAGPEQVGTALCDMDWMEEQVKALRKEGWLPIVSFQHFEYYDYKAQPLQERDFRRMAQAGAWIVSGSQAHQPQGMEFQGAHFIHYGLGNLFFDQFSIGAPMRQGFIDRHVFYDGRYLGVELFTIQFVDHARPRFMTSEERDDLLKTIFDASGW